jgi:hypothetical protein
MTQTPVASGFDMVGDGPSQLLGAFINYLRAPRSRGESESTGFGVVDGNTARCDVLSENTSTPASVRITIDA